MVTGWDGGRVIAAVGFGVGRLTDRLAEQRENQTGPSNASSWQHLMFQGPKPLFYGEHAGNAFRNDEGPIEVSPINM
jgi:hypothetical protein